MQAGAVHDSLDLKSFSLVQNAHALLSRNDSAASFSTGMGGGGGEVTSPPSQSRTGGGGSGSGISYASAAKGMPRMALPGRDGADAVPSPPLSQRLPASGGKAGATADRLPSPNDTSPKSQARLPTDGA